MGAGRIVALDPEFDGAWQLAMASDHGEPAAHIRVALDLHGCGAGRARRLLHASARSGLAGVLPIPPGAVRSTHLLEIAGPGGSALYRFRSALCSSRRRVWRYPHQRLGHVDSL